MATRTITRKGRVTRERIVAAAARLIHERGVGATTLQDVEAAASVGRSQIYHYFSGKHELVEAVIDFQAEGVLSAATMSNGLCTWEAWRAWESETLRHSSEHDCMGGCPLGSLVSELADASEEARARLSARFRQWESSFRAGISRMQRDGLIQPAADPVWLATAIMTGLEGGLLMSQTHRETKYLEVALGSALAHLRSHALSQ